MGSYISKFIQCPYYHTDEKQQVICEGIVEKSTIHVSFSDRKVCTQFKVDYCGSVDGWKKCRIAQTLENMYDERGNRNV